MEVRRRRPARPLHCPSYSAGDCILETIPNRIPNYILNFTTNCTANCKTNYIVWNILNCAVRTEKNSRMKLIPDCFVCNVLNCILNCMTRSRTKDITY